MHKLRQYRGLIKKINILLEAVLIFAMYWLATWLRFVIPIGKGFAIFDGVKFVVLAVAFTVTFVAVTYFAGGYFSFHKGLIKGFREVLFSMMIGMCINCTIIYLFKMEQFSRLLLFYYAVLTVIVIYLKRIFFSKFADWYAKKYEIKTNVIMFGRGRLAVTVYRTIFQEKKSGMNLLGYVAEKENNRIPDYLGSLDEIDIIPNTAAGQLVRQENSVHPDMLLIADPKLGREEIKKIVVYGTNHDIRVCIVPEFSEFMPSKNAISAIEGNYICELSAFDTCNIMGVNISVTNMEKTVNKIKDNLHEWSGKYICVSNVHTTVTASEDDSYKDIQNKAVIALPDGGPLSKFSRETGHEGASRVTGPDLMQRILIDSAENGWRHFFYGSTEETLSKLEKVIGEKYPGAFICGMISPPFRPLTVEEDREIINKINEAKPDFVWVGLGAPKQEVWMAAHEDKICGLMVGVGAAFDYESGNIKRAPKWMQERNLEWFYRLMQDPKRLFTRYLTTNTKYLMWKYQHGGKE